jgi:hypothetical protein
MRTHIDWLTFTMTMRYSDETNDAYANAMENAFMDTFGGMLVQTAFGGSWEKKEKSRAPYMDAWQIGGGGISLFASPSLTHCCIEISGQGCERLLEQSILAEILVRVAARVTRIDIATDIDTNVIPTDFVSITNHKRMRASGYQKSETGETAYVGSQKSDRYARVYRYAPPHPRAHLLRVEHVFRRDYAKTVAQACVANDLSAVAMAAGQAFGWSHPTWDVQAKATVDLSVVKAEHNGGKTVYWLIKSCAPAFKRLCEDGTIRDPEAFIIEYFYPNTRREND